MANDNEATNDQAVLTTMFFNTLSIDGLFSVAPKKASVCYIQNGPQASSCTRSNRKFIKLQAGFLAQTIIVMRILWSPVQPDKPLVSVIYMLSLFSIQSN